MPPVSQAQRRWAWANKDAGGKTGKAAAEFAKADPGGKLPPRVKAGKPLKAGQGETGLINKYGKR